LGLITVLMTLLGWASVPLFITYLSSSVDVWTQNGWRYAISALLWAPVLILGRIKRTLPAGLWKAALVPAVANALGQTLFTLAYYHVDAATATFGLRMQIVFLAVGAYLMFPSERALLRTPQAWLGIALVLGGITLTIFQRSAEPIHSAAGTGGAAGLGGQSATLGVIAAIASGLLFAVYGLAVRRNMHGFHPVTAFAAISQLTAAICVAFMIGFAGHYVEAAEGTKTFVHDGGASVFHLSAFGMLMMALSSIIGIALGHVFYYISIARLGVAVTSGVIQLQPFCLAAMLYVFQGKALTTGQWIGGTIAVCGAVLLLHTQWFLGRRQDLQPAGKIEQETIPGEEPVGIEAAEMDAMPVESNRSLRK
jgi:drug/metabolite transporter (DMT)-like permease